MADTSTKPYLIRAIHEWCTDNGYTPYLAVAVDARTIVPREHVRNGEIVLNVSAMATHKLSLGNEFVEFQARFGGVARELSIPIENVTAIYARENGHGMAFEVPKAPALADADAPVDAPAGEGEGDGETATPAVPPSAGAPAARRAPPRRRGPRLVPIDGDGGEADASGSPGAEAAATGTSRDEPADAPAASVPPSPASAPAGESAPADGHNGPDDRGPAPGRPRLTRIK